MYNCAKSDKITHSYIESCVLLSVFETQIEQFIAATDHLYLHNCVLLSCQYQNWGNLQTIQTCSMFNTLKSKAFSEIMAIFQKLSKEKLNSLKRLQVYYRSLIWNSANQAKEFQIIEKLNCIFLNFLKVYKLIKTANLEIFGTFI